MRIFVILFLVSYSFVFSFAQGCWDLQYIPIDSISNDLESKEIRIDFKSSYIDSTYEGLNIRSLLSKQDTTLLSIDGATIFYIEDWKLYPDHGVLSEQNLINISNKNLIKEIFIKSINDSTIVVDMNFYEYKKNELVKLTFICTKTIIIYKTIIKGILFRRDEKQ